jgi:hypothetical protein
MICCEQTISAFFNESTTTVPYTGNRPTVTVNYKQPDGSYLAAGIFTLIEVTPTEVIVDHGGPSTGVVKLLQ